ncbi:hypothetical protein pdam_00021483, partial [Pocillopora damicornis]
MCKGNSKAPSSSLAFWGLAEYIGNRPDVSHQVWDLQSTKAPNGMKIVLFADFMSSSHGLNQAQYMLKQLCNEGHQITLFGNNFTWRPYGVQCVLLGGSVHSRKVAMRLRVLLEGSDYPYMSGVLPRRCSWTQMYAVDPSLETPGPCVL